MKIFISFLLFTVVHSFSFSQVKSITFLSTRKLSSIDIENIKSVYKSVIGKNGKKIGKYKFILKSCLNSEEIVINTTDDFYLNQQNSFNRDFVSTNDEIVYIMSIIPGKKTFEFKTSSDILLTASIPSLSVSSDLIKRIQKSKENEIIVIWNNGFEPYIFSSVNINTIIKQSNKSNSLDALRPRILKPNVKQRDLRPDESHYYIEFDSVGIFPSYQVQIFWKFQDGMDYMGNTVYDSVLFVNECIDFITEEEFKEGKEDYDFALFSVFDSKCKIALSSDYLANICYQEDTQKLNTQELKNEEDCTPCKYDCLYQKKFSVVIKGCATGVKEESIPGSTLNFNYFLIQCDYKQKS
jgi:hypothetical protein